MTSINSSLHCLGNVIAALSSTTRTHVPYRDSKLTRLLQDSLGGNTRTIVMACIAPTALHAAETVSTLQFADRAKSVMLRVKANTIVDDKELLSRAHAEIARLKTLLAHALKRAEGHGGESGQEDLERLLEENEKLRKENEGMRYQLEHPRKHTSRKPSQGTGSSRGGNREKESQLSQSQSQQVPSQQQYYQQQQQQQQQLYGGNNNGTGNGNGEYNDSLPRQGQGLGPAPGQGLGPASQKNGVGAASNAIGIARGVSFHASPGQVLGKYKAPPDIKVRVRHPSGTSLLYH